MGVPGSERSRVGLSVGCCTEKSKGVNCVSHVALLKLECQTAIDYPYMKGQLELTLIVQSQLKLTIDISRVISSLTLFYQSQVGNTVDTFTFLCVVIKSLYTRTALRKCLTYRCLRGYGSRVKK